MRPSVLAALLSAATASAAFHLPAHAQVFRWVDATGVVNYGASPPKQGNAVMLTAESSRLSVVSAAPLQRASAGAALPGTTPRSVPVAGLVDRSTLGDVSRTLAVRERCFAERRVDCADPSVATYDHTPAYLPSTR